MDLDNNRIDDAVLALLYLNGDLKDQRAWKSFDWDAMNRLHERGLISNPATKAKSVVLSDEAIEKARRLCLKLFGR